jgi:HEAT repeat protein/uncharacterized integral membrane protein
MIATILIVLIIILLVAIFSVQNAIPVIISFFFWRFEASLAIVIFLSVLIGLITGVIIAFLLRIKPSTNTIKVEGNSNMHKKFLIFTIFICSLLGTMQMSRSDDIDKLISDINTGDGKTRLSAVEKLGKIKDERSVDLLMNVANMSGEAWKIKIRAIRLLGEIGNVKAIDLLTKIFNDPFLNNECPAIKWNTAIALGNFKNNSKVVDTLINGLQNENEILGTREAVIQSLGKIGDLKAVPFLITALDDKSFAIKLSAIRALGQIRDLQVVPTLKRIVDSNCDPYIKNEALSALRNFPTKGN